MSKTAISTAVLYTLFAVLSTAINICVQMLFTWLYKGNHSVELSILIGTVSVLPLRYVLEKRYIFAFKSNGVAHDGRTFSLYSFMGVFTTGIFWGIEYIFHFFFMVDILRYIGGVMGLAAGFYAKYQLDKKYVFASWNKQVTA